MKRSLKKQAPPVIAITLGDSLHDELMLLPGPADALALAQQYWDARKEFRFGVPTGSLSECIEQAQRLNTKPVVLSDSGDNPTGGGTGDERDPHNQPGESERHGGLLREGSGALRAAAARRV